MSHAATRLTLYALISAVEEDLRSVIELHLSAIGDVHKILGDDIFGRAQSRLIKEQGLSEKEPSLAELLAYIDFADTYQVLNGNGQFLPRKLQEFLRSNTNKFEELAPIRNRVMHARPLDFDDLPKTLQHAQSLARGTQMTWVNVAETLDRLKKEPSFVLGLTIPFDDADAKVQSHNLPTPDFDETGFLGRESQIRDLVKLCAGPYPVVTVFGEGGAGKTSLALKVAYDLLDTNESPFDAIVWTSAKTARLTALEVQQIEGAIADSLGLFRDVARHLAGSQDTDAMEEVLGYLTQFKILLIMDNLETVLDERIRTFLAKLPTGSKVLITSRIGLGAFDYPYKLQALTPGESVQLLRAVAGARGLDDMLKIPNKKLEEYCGRMKHNPGFIKWFVSAVQAGMRPEEVLAKPDIFLDFCMTNVYVYLADLSKKVLQVMITVPGKLSQAELVFLTELDVIELQKALQQLIITNFVLMTSKPSGSSFETKYSISELARAFLTKHYPATPQVSSETIKRKRLLVVAGEQIRADQSRNPYLYESITARSSGDLLIARYLLDALNSSKRNEIQKADKALTTARDLAPDFFEVYRVEALVRLRDNNLQGARDAYENAISLEPKSAPLRLWYACFLARYFDDIEAALAHLKTGLTLDPSSEELKLEFARLALFARDFVAAEKLLEELLPSLKTCGKWMQRKYNDLCLMHRQRKADCLVSEHDWHGALDELFALKNVFESIPPPDIDDRMRSKVGRAIPTLHKCSTHLDDVETRLHANELLGWMRTAAREQVHESDAPSTPQALPDSRSVTEGTVATLKPAFGFIRTKSDETIFFHRTGLLNPKDWIRLEVGTAVTFIESADGSKGKKACAIRLRDQTPLPVDGR